MPRRQRLQEEHRQAIARMIRSSDRDLAEIAREFGVTRERIRQIGEERCPRSMERRRRSRQRMTQQTAKARRKELEDAQRQAMKTTKCYVCEQKFIYDTRYLPQTGRRFCGTDCRALFNGYLHYYVVNEVRVDHALYLIRNPEKARGEAMLRNAQRIVNEYNKTGTVVPRRRVNSNPINALKLAKHIGIDLYATRDRLMKLAGTFDPAIPPLPRPKGK